MSRETFIINNKEYAASKIAAFAANGIILKLQKLILPVLAESTGGKDAMEMDVGAMARLVSDRLDDSVISDIILPMFKLSQVACTTDEFKTKIDSEMAINKVFVDADGLADFYELIYEVLKFNFSGFFVQIAGRFGLQNGAAKATA